MWFIRNFYYAVLAKCFEGDLKDWIPAFAGMTKWCVVSSRLTELKERES